MNYLEAIAYLYGLADYEKKRLERYTADTLDLSRIERLLAALGNPHTRFPAVHIAGSKGKGSTAAMCESCLRAAGYRTGFYISPHLHTFRERIQVGGQLVLKEEVVALVEEARPLIERVPGLTYFEAVTALAFLHFARVGVDVAVVEVGLGGRLDATNVLTPVVSVITALSLEHTYLLGDTLAQIAREKAGIIKPGVPVVSAPQPEEAADVIRAVSQERDAPLTVVGRDWIYLPGPFDLEGQGFTVRRATDHSSELEGEYWIPLLGRHQLENAANAIATLDILRERGWRIPADAVRVGMRRVDWPGRMEVLSRAPLLIADGAHNPRSAEILCAALAEWFPGRRWVMIFGASDDKDIAGMLNVLLPISEHVIVTRSDHPRSAAPSRLADVVATLGRGAEISVNVKKALQRGLAVMRPEHGLLITGSLHMVADAREAWADHTGSAAGRPDRDTE